MQLFSADTKMFSNNFLLPAKSWKNHPQKLLRNTQIHFFFLTASSAQAAQTEECMFQNVAYRLTVYRTGVLSWPFEFLDSSNPVRAYDGTTKFRQSTPVLTNHRTAEYSRVFLLRQRWIVNYSVKSGSEILSNENINIGVSVVFKTTRE
jgi:hypothetical protein